MSDRKREVLRGSLTERNFDELVFFTNGTPLGNLFAEGGD
jgi:hypothetical protein